MIRRKKIVNSRRVERKLEKLVDAEKTIKSTIKWAKTRKFLRVMKYVLVLVLFVLASYYTGSGVSLVREYLQIEWVGLRTKLVEEWGLVKYAIKTVDYSDSEIETLKKTYSEKYHLEPTIISALVAQESGDLPHISKNFRYRFEQGWKNDYSKKYPRRGSYNDEEYNLIFSSIGLCQVGYVIWKDFCELDMVTDLFNPATNLDCAARIMSRCLEDNASKYHRNSDLLRTCFRKYNGSGVKAEEYAEKMMLRLTDSVLDRQQILSSKPSRNTQTEMKRQKIAKELESTPLPDKIDRRPDVQYDDTGRFNDGEPSILSSNKIACEYIGGCEMKLDENGEPYIDHESNIKHPKKKKRK